MIDNTPIKLPVIVDIKIGNLYLFIQSGSLNGIVHAGASGDMNAFITALDMNPKLLKIGNVTAKRHKLQVRENNIMEPKIAIVDGEHIYIDPLT